MFITLIHVLLATSSVRDVQLSCSYLLSFCLPTPQTRIAAFTANLSTPSLHTSPLFGKPSSLSTLLFALVVSSKALYTADISTRCNPTKSHISDPLKIRSTIASRVSGGGCSTRAAPHFHVFLYIGFENAATAKAVLDIRNAA